jgi:hypothetical protein
MAQPESDIPTTGAPAERRRGRWLAVVAAAAVALAIAAIAWHAYATLSYQRSFDAKLSLIARRDAAARAAHMEPWDAHFATRATVMRLWQHGSALLAQGAALPAMLELGEAYRLDVGDKELLALFKQSQAQLDYDSNRKAHLQHGHEGPGGTLRPQDLER